MSGDKEKPGEIKVESHKERSKGYNSYDGDGIDPSVAAVQITSFEDVPVPGGVLSGRQVSRQNFVQEGVYTDKVKGFTTGHRENNFELVFTPKTVTPGGTIITGAQQTVAIEKGEDEVNVRGDLIENPKLHQDIARAWDAAKVKQEGEKGPTITPVEAKALAGLLHKATNELCQVEPDSCPNAKAGKSRGGRCE